MRLKRLELYGFKSFAARTVFDFAEGIAAIVGPNGSGKSNIADAIRWAMGEQSFSTLRAKNSEDVVFAGAGSHPRMGMAQVLITLDNSEGLLPLEFSEVVIGRRAYRSGENEYLINGSQVRLRDVQDILSSAGLGRSQYTVIGQGMVDAILTLRPEARRGLFEEAAGLAPHLRKREESLRRIEETERNLERLGDILAELSPQAKNLQRQAERAEEYLSLKRDLEQAERTWYAYQWHKRQRALAEAEGQLGSALAHLEAQRERAAQLATRIKEREDAKRAREQESQKLSQALAEVRRQTERGQQELALAVEKSALYEQQLKALALEQDSLHSRRMVLSQEIERVSQELAEQERLHLATQEELSDVRTRLARTNASRKEAEQQARDAEDRLRHLDAALAAQEAQLEQLAGREQALLSEEEAIQAQVRVLEDKIADLASSLHDHEQKVIALETAKRDHLARLAELHRELEEASQAVETLEQETARIARQRDDLASRRDLLGRLRLEMAGYYPGVRAVLGKGKALPGLLGTVVNLMRVPPRLETAVESALGSRLQDVIAETWDDAAAAIRYLKERRAGWATFLPLDALKPRQPLRLDPSPGVVGVASQLIEYEARLRPAYEAILGQVVVVEDLATARRLLDAHLRAALIVTLEGEIVQPSGALSGGTRQRGTDLLAQEREWQALPGRLAQVEASLLEHRERLARQQGVLGELGAQAEALERSAKSLQQEGETAEREADTIRGELVQANREREWQISRMERTRHERAEILSRHDEVAKQILRARKERDKALAAARLAREHLALTDDDDLRRLAGELETRAAVAERTVESQRTLLKTHTSNLAEIDSQAAQKQAEADSLKSLLEQLGTSIQKQRARIRESQAEELALSERLEPLRRALAEAERIDRSLEEERSRVGEMLREAELAHSRATLQRDRAKDELRALANEIEARLGPIQHPDKATHQLRLDLGERVVAFPETDSIPPDLEETIRQIRARLRQLGNVNPDAPAEYRALLERRTFLESQEKDLRAAIASLKEVIRELDNLIERDLADTITTVDMAFGEYFERLFGGGTARLVLTDPDNLGTTGVDIIARLPGKRAQNLSLLSGGERALTAVALIFALLRANPVPFCCLDEVDAALDEANVQRFRSLLEEHSQTTQFVVITHNRRTIEAAEVIYGVSMSEPGISQSISLTLPKMERHDVEDMEQQGTPRHMPLRLPPEAQEGDRRDELTG